MVEEQIWDFHTKFADPDRYKLIRLTEPNN